MIYQVLEKYRIDRHLDRRIVLLLDVAVVAFSAIASILFVGVLASNLYDLDYTLLWIGAALISGSISFCLLKTYSSVVRNSTIYELCKLFLAVLLKNVLMGGILMVPHLHEDYSFPHLCALLVVDALLCISILVVERAVVVVCYDVMMQNSQRRRRSQAVFVYGTSEAAQEFVMMQQGSDKYDIIGFLSYGKRKSKYHFANSMAYEFSDENRLRHITDMSDVNAIVFVSQDEVNAEETRLVSYCNKNNIKILIVPPVQELGKRVGKKQALREIKIEDLLGRPEIQLPTDNVVSKFADKVIMVTGAAGSIGSELCRQLATFGIKKLVLYDNAETPMHNLRLELEEKFPDLDFVPVIGDIRMPKRLDFAFQKWHPQIVFHAGAYKHVPLMEENPCEAVLANVAGSRNVADKCREYDVEMMVMVSTDKAVNPTNIMGCTKRLAEIYVQSLANAISSGEIEGKTMYVTTRFGNVLGSNGSVIPRFRDQIANGGPVTVTHPEITRFFMTIPEACRLVMEAATLGEENKIFVFDMGKSVKIADLAKRMIELAGFTPDKDVKIEYTGLRPGEKLYEEVLASTENTIPTEHKSIRVAKVRSYNYQDAVNAVDKLEKLSREVNIPEMVTMMKRIVPEFKSKNSEFEKYDMIVEDEFLKKMRP